MSGEDFAGHTALITGAASGIGKACAEWLDQRGIAELVLVDMDEPGLEGLEMSCQRRHFVGDVTNPELWARIEVELPALHYAVINAGIANGCPLIEQDFGKWRRLLSVNLDGAFLGLRAALRTMQKAGTGKSIVLTSSVAGIKPLPGTAAYGSSKAAVAHLARIAAAEHAKDNIRVNAVAPGRVDTPIWSKTEGFRSLVEQLGSREAAIAKLGAESTPMDRFATADELAGQIGFLLSDAGANITGTVLVSDGGYSL